MHGKDGDAGSISGNAVFRPQLHIGLPISAFADPFEPRISSSSMSSSENRLKRVNPSDPGSGENFSRADAAGDWRAWGIVLFGNGCPFRGSLITIGGLRESSEEKSPVRKAAGIVSCCESPATARSHVR